MKTPRTRLLGFLFATALAAAALPCIAQRDPLPFPSADEAEPEGKLPQVISRVEAIYPAGLEGRFEEDVYVAFVVNQKGVPVKVRAFFSQHDAFEAPAVEAVKQWTFTPGVLGNGKVVNTQMVVAIHFAPPAP